MLPLRRSVGFGSHMGDARFILLLGKIKMKTRSQSILEKYLFLSPIAQVIKKLPVRIASNLEDELDDVFRRESVMVERLSKGQENKMLVGIKRWISYITMVHEQLVSTERRVNAKVKDVHDINKIKSGLLLQYCSVVNMLLSHGGLEEASIESVVTALLLGLKHEDFQVQQATVQCLENIMVGILENLDKIAEETKRKEIEKLMVMQFEKVIAIFMVGLRDSDPKVRLVVTRSLGNVLKVFDKITGATERRIIEEIIGDQLRRVVMSSLARFMESDVDLAIEMEVVGNVVLEILENLTNIREEVERTKLEKTIAMCIGGIIVGLLAGLRNPYWRIRQISARYLGKVTIGIITGLAKIGGGAEREAVEQLVVIKLKDITTALSSGLNDADLDVKRAASASLIYIEGMITRLCSRSDSIQLMSATAVEYLMNLKIERLEKPGRILIGGGVTVEPVRKDTQEFTVAQLNEMAIKLLTLLKAQYPNIASIMRTLSDLILGILRNLRGVAEEAMGSQIEELLIAQLENIVAVLLNRLKILKALKSLEEIREEVARLQKEELVAIQLKDAALFDALKRCDKRDVVQNLNDVMLEILKSLEKIHGKTTKLRIETLLVTQLGDVVAILLDMEKTETSIFSSVKPYVMQNLNKIMLEILENFEKIKGEAARLQMMDMITALLTKLKKEYPDIERTVVRNLSAVMLTILNRPEEARGNSARLQVVKLMITQLKDVVTTLLDRLPTSGWYERQTIMQDLSNLIIEALERLDEIREQIDRENMEELITIQLKEIVTALLVRLGDVCGSVRQVAVQCLSNVLDSFDRIKDPRARQIAEETITRQLVKVFLITLNDSQWYIRRTTMQHFKSILKVIDKIRDEKVRTELENAIVCQLKEVMAALFTGLNDSTWWKKQAVAEDLGNIIVEMLENLDKIKSEVERTSMEGLITLQLLKEVVTVLFTGFMEQDDWIIKRVIAESLENIMLKILENLDKMEKETNEGKIEKFMITQLQEFVSMLLVGLASEYSKVRQAAMQGLEKIGRFNEKEMLAVWMARALSQDCAKELPEADDEHQKGKDKVDAVLPSVSMGVGFFGEPKRGDGAAAASPSAETNLGVL